MRLRLLKWRMHGLLDLPCICNTQWIPQYIARWLEWLNNMVLSSTANNLFREIFSEKEIIFWVLLLRDTLNIYGCFLGKKMPFGYPFSEANILWLLYFLNFAPSEGDLWQFQVEACGAYACKQILGLCHPPQMKVKWKILFRREINSLWLVMIMDWRPVNCVVSVSVCRRRWYH